MAKFKLTLIVVLIALTTIVAFASAQRTRYTLWFYINHNEVGVMDSEEFEVMCSEYGRGCVLPIPSLNGELRQVFIDNEGNIPIAPEY